MFVGFGLLLVIVLFTALIGPYFVDWTQYKQDFEEQASRITGQNVKVGGDAEVRLLPLPSLSFTDLSVGQNADGSPMLTVERFSANVELMPFLSGEIRIVDMALESPNFNFNIDENGQIAWTDRKQLLVNPGQVELDKLKVTNGGFTISGLADGRSIKGAGIAADISARSLFGPWRINGEGLIDGANSHFQISTGTYSSDNPMRLKIQANWEGIPYLLGADGQVALREGVLEWSGKFNIDPDTSSASTSLISEKNDPLPVKTEGDFVLSPARLDVPQYRSEIGDSEDPFILTGKAATALRSGIDFRLEVDGRQIDVDRIARMQGGEDAIAPTLEARITLLRDIINRIPVPDFAGEIDLEIPAIIAGDTYIREVSAIIRPFGAGWEVVRLKTQLPGNTLVEANGRMGTNEDFGFHGKLLVASRQPSGFAAWAVGRVDPSIRQLNVAGFSSQVTLTGNQTSFDQLELFLNKNRLNGSIKRIAPVDDGEGAPAIIANLSGNRVSVEDLRAIASLVVGGEKSAVDSIAISHDFDITLKAEEFSGFDIEARGVDTQFQYKGGALSIARLRVTDFLGAQIDSKGQISDLLAAPEGNLALSLEADDLSRLARLAKSKMQNVPVSIAPVLEAFGDNPRLSKATKLSIEVDSRALENEGSRQSRSRILINGNIAGTAVNIRSGLRGNLREQDALWIDLSGDFSSSDSFVLGSQLGLGKLGFTDIYGGLPGPAKVSIESVGEPKEGFSTILNVELPGTIFSAKGVLASPGSVDVGNEIEITAGSENAAPFAAAFGYLLPGLNHVLGDAAPLSFNGHVSSTSPAGISLVIKKASLGGNAFAGQLDFSNLNEEMKSVEGQLEMDRISLSVIGGGLLGFDPDLVKFGGFSSAGDVPFSGPSIAGLSGKVKLNAGIFETGSSENGTDAGAELSVRGNRIEIADFTMNWFDGKVTGSGTLGQVNGTTTLNGQYALTGIDGARLLQASGQPVFAESRAGLSGTIESAGKTPEAFFKALSGSGVLTYDDARLNGISAEGLEDIFEVTDQEGFEISPASVAPLAEQAFLKGSMKLEDGSVPYTLRKGELRLRNITLKDANKASAKPAKADLLLDLASGRMSAKINISPDPKNQSVAGASPEVVFSWVGVPGELQRNTDTNGLEGFLSIRAFEAEQRRVELLQAALLEKQRFRRDLLNSGERGRWLQAKRIAELKRIEEARRAAEEAARLEAERLAKEEAERKAREEAERKAREEAERKAREQEAARIAAEKAAAEAARKAQLEAEQKAEAARIAAEKRAAEEAAKTSKGVGQGKEGIEIRSLPSPTSRQSGTPATDGAKNAPPKNLFENIEKLLFQ